MDIEYLDDAKRFLLEEPKKLLKAYGALADKVDASLPRRTVDLENRIQAFKDLTDYISNHLTDTITEKPNFKFKGTVYANIYVVHFPPYRLLFQVTKTHSRALCILATVGDHSNQAIKNLADLYAADDTDHQSDEEN